MSELVLAKDRNVPREMASVNLIGSPVWKNLGAGEQTFYYLDLPLHGTNLPFTKCDFGHTAVLRPSQKQPLKNANKQHNPSHPRLQRIGLVGISEAHTKHV